MQDTKENLVLLTLDVNDPRRNEELVKEPYHSLIFPYAFIIDTRNE